MLELKKKLASYCIKNNLHPMETIVKNININSFRVVIGDEVYSFQHDEIDDALYTLYELGYEPGDETQYGDMVDMVVDVETESGNSGGVLKIAHGLPPHILTFSNVN